MKSECACSGDGSYFTGIYRVHVTKDMFNSPLGYLESLGNGVHTFVQLQKYRVENGIPLVDIRLSLLEVVDSLWIRRTAGTFVGKASARFDKQSRKVAIQLMGESQPFNVNALTLEYGNPKKDDRYGKLVVPIHCAADLTVKCSSTQATLAKTSEQILLAEEHLVFDCFGVQYRCGHDNCHTLCIDHACNYHCESRICNNFSQCGDWHNAGPSCDPLTCNG